MTLRDWSLKLLPWSLLMICAWALAGVGLSPAAPGAPSSQPPLSPSAALAPPMDHSQLQARLDLLLQDRKMANTAVSVEVRDCETGEQVYSREPERLLNPASNLKLLTTAAALDVLGPAYRFQTAVLRDGPLEHGIVKGNVYLRGGGDPELVYEGVWKMVKDLQAQGLRGIDGDLVADDTFFDAVRSIPNWKQDVLDGDTQAYNPPLGALSTNFNTVAIIVRPGDHPGKPPEVSFETPTDYVRVINKASTGRRRGANTLSFDRTSSSERGEVLTLSGRIPEDSGYRRYYRTITDPPTFALALFSEMMKREGISIKGGLRLGKTPEGAANLYTRYSSSLDILIRYMNKLSSNFIAEMLLKTLAAEVSGAPGTSEQGLVVLRDYLERSKLDWSTAQYYNGSGLSGDTRVSSSHLVSLLCQVQKDFKKRFDFVAALPISGVDGTMRRRMLGTPAAGMVRAKTGSVNGVFGFSGYLESATGRIWAFSFLVNDIQGSVANIKSIQDRWANVLVAGEGMESAPEGAGERMEGAGEGEMGQPGDSISDEG